MSLQSILGRVFKGGISILQGSGLYSTNEYIDNIYNNPAFTMAQQKKSKALKAVEWGVFKVDKDGNKKELPDHVLNTIFKMPNKNCTWGEFLEYITAWFDSKDNGVLIERIWTTKSFAPRLNLYNPDNFTCYFNGTELNKIVILEPSKTITDSQELENYMWIKQPNFEANMAGVDYGSVSSGTTKQRGMALLGSYVYNAWRWNNSLVKNSGKRPGLYTSERPLTPIQEEKFRQSIGSKNTLDDKGKDLLVSGNMKYTQTAADPKDSDWIIGEKIAHERIAGSLGVPSELVAGGDSTYTNRQEARKELYHEEIIPWCREITKRLNMFLGEWLGKNEKIDFLTSSIPALQNDLANVVQSLSGAKDRMTVNEYRKVIADMTDYDLEGVENGNEILVSSTSVGLNELKDDIEGV